MKFSGINYESFSDGEGVRVTLFTSGCPHKCPGCHNKDAWDENYGEELTDDIIAKINDKLSCDYISGLTLSGGDPFMNPDELLPVLRKLKFKNLWIYTGYTIDELHELKRVSDSIKEILSMANVIVEGRYIEKLRDVSLPFRGSSNQRIIQLLNRR